VLLLVKKLCVCNYTLLSFQGSARAGTNTRVSCQLLYLLVVTLFIVVCIIKLIIISLLLHRGNSQSRIVLAVCVCNFVTMVVTRRTLGDFEKNS